MKFLKYILIVCLSVFSNSGYASSTDIYSIVCLEVNYVDNLYQEEELPDILDFNSPLETKIKRNKKLFKPKGVQVIMPNVGCLVFQRFSHFSYNLDEYIEYIYTHKLYYSHGKRGPPSNRV